MADSARVTEKMAASLAVELKAKKQGDIDAINNIFHERDKERYRRTKQSKMEMNEL